MSKLKSSSHFVQSCFNYETNHLILVDAILQLGDHKIITMMNDQFANYVIQTALKNANRRQKKDFKNKGNTNRNQLKTKKFGKYILKLLDG